jgi:signal transduction histidine kinase
MRTLTWEHFLAPARWLAPPVVDKAQQAARLRFIERDVGLPVRAVVLGGLFYFLFLSDWFAGLNLIGQVAIEVVRIAFLAYAGANLVAAGLYVFMDRLPFGFIRWVAFLISFIDGLFFAVVTLATGGLESLAYWLFLALMARNAFAFPVASLQVSLNLLLIGSYLYAGFLDRQFSGFEQATVERLDELDMARREAGIRRTVAPRSPDEARQAVAEATAALTATYSLLTNAQAVFDARFAEAKAFANSSANRNTNAAAGPFHRAFREYTRLFLRYKTAYVTYTDALPYHLKYLSLTQPPDPALAAADQHAKEVKAQYDAAADLYGQDGTRYSELASRLPQSERREHRPGAQAEPLATRALYGGAEGAPGHQYLLLRIFLMLLTTACCYGVQVYSDRHRLALEEAREFHARQRQLEAAGQLAAQIAHQLKNPLGIINNAAFCLQRVLPAAPPVAIQQLGIIREEIERADKIITQLMDYAHLAEGQVERLDFAASLQSAVAQVFPPGAHDGVVVQTDVAPGLPPLLMQSAHLAEILVNLLLNAREAVNGQGRVEVTAGPLPDGGIEVRVRDTGPGIPPDRLEQVFEPYFSTKAKGTGLGLAIVRQKVRMYGGTVRIESVLGKGATFVLQLPTRTFMKEQT